jgi:signal transduction histidine kinase
METKDFVTASLGELAEDCAGKLRGVLINSKENKTININHPKRDIYIKCDDESLLRALMNITANCLRYAETTVDIDFYETEKNVILTIKDDGAGIDEKELPNIFKRFYKGKGGKHGIGLSIAKSIIEQHNAEITAANRTDGHSGAEFMIVFTKNDE